MYVAVVSDGFSVELFPKRGAFSRIKGVYTGPTRWSVFKQNMRELYSDYCYWRLELPHDPLLDIIYISILIRRKFQKDCLDPAKLHQKWGHHTPLSLSRREITTLHAETRMFWHDPLFAALTDEHEFHFFPHDPICRQRFCNDAAISASGLERTLFLVQLATGRYLYRRSWRGAKPSHIGLHGQWCSGVESDEQCSAFNPKYWVEHPERMGYGGFAEDDADVEAWWMKELANPKHPLPPAFPV